MKVHHTSLILFLRFLVSMFFVYHAARKKIKYALGAWKRYLELNKLDWELYSCVHMEAQDTETLDVEEHILAKEIYK